MVAPDGSLWAWGGREDGVDLGVLHGLTPHKISKDRDWKQVAAGFFGLVALRQDGSLWGVGANTEGLLGIDGVTNTVQELTRVGSDTDWKAIKAGVSHCMALKKDGSLWTWGQNSYGQIGVGFLSPREPITRIGFETNWISIRPGAFNSFGLRTDGTIWMWGLDFAPRGNNPIPTQLGTETNWTAIAAGDYHLIATDSGGTNWLIGSNAMYIEPGASNPTTNWIRITAATNWTQIQSGENCLLARDASGKWVAAGEVGNSDIADHWDFEHDFAPLAIHIQRSTTLFMMPDGRLWSLGKRIGGKPQPSVLEKLRNTVVLFVTRKQPASAREDFDSEPFFVWEQRGEN